MNEMKMPGFSAEASLYRTTNHYGFAAGGSFLSDGSTTVIPQDCGFIKWLSCGVLIGTGVIVCGGACASGIAVACAGCIATVFGGTLAIDCYDCLPEWIRDVIEGGGSGGGGGGGGGTGGPCGCPRGTRCCGGCTKVPGQGLVCNDECIGPGEVCP